MIADPAPGRGEARAGNSLAAGLLAAAFPIGFFVFVVLFVPLLDRFEMNMDEGIELMKGMLFARGYTLYTEIWSNQTPLFTAALGWLFRVSGENVLAARLLVLASSAALLWAAFEILRRTWGIAHAAAGVLLLLLSPYYLRFSVLAMAGVPALSLAVLALLFLVFWRDRQKEYWLLLSALSLGLSVLIKAFTAFLAAVMLAGILAAGLGQSRDAWRDPVSWWPALLWTAVFGAVTVIPALGVIGLYHFEMLTGMHESARTLDFYEQFELYRQAEGIRWLLSLSLLAIPFAVSRGGGETIYLLGWLGAAYLVLSLHLPVWNHHLLLLGVPAAMVGGIGVAEAIKYLRATASPRGPFPVAAVLAVLVVLAAGVAVGQQTGMVVHEIRPDPAVAEREARARSLVDEMRARAPDTRWAFTDHYQYAFRAGLPVPPALASISDMQLRTSTLTEERILEIIDDYEPEQILVARFELPLVRGLAAEGYRLVREQDGAALFVRSDLE